MKSSTLKAKLATLSFFEFAIWGTYLVSMGMFLYHVGLGQEIFLFYMVQGLVSLFMPAVMGIVADRWLPAQKNLGSMPLHSRHIYVCRRILCHVGTA